MSVIRKVKRAVRGDIKLTTAALEGLRRSRVSFAGWRDLSSLTQVANRPARLRDSFAHMNAKELLAHFRERDKPKFFPGFTDPSNPAAQQRIFPSETAELLRGANGIKERHCWSLLGFGEKCFGAQIEWRRDPLSGYISPLVYHRNVRLIRADGSDARVLWELNRLGHFLTLGRAYAVTRDESFSSEFFNQVESWSSQNPYGQGPNWACAMEVALRAMNLLGAFELFRQSPQLTEERLSHLLALLDQHGTYIRRNLEFSYLATSNHYLSDVVGLLWLGIMLPELSDANEWRQFGVREMLKEMDKQILPDGADCEASTGYHRFVLELVLYSFLLCRFNIIAIPERYWKKVRLMLEYVRSYMRPDGSAPLIGDSDGGQVLPICVRRSDDHAYLLSLGAVALDGSLLSPADTKLTEELLWLLGKDGIARFEGLPKPAELPESRSFPDAGTHILRKDDLYLCFNTSGAGLNGRGSHGHNDVLSIDVSVCGRAFIVDPGTYVYTADLRARHQFRSTAYHSTVEVDEQDQNTTVVDSPFVIGNEADPRVLLWETAPELDRVSAEHYGYRRLESPLTHRRTISFDKGRRCWLIDDEFFADGAHSLAIRFHFDSGLEVECSDSVVVARDPKLGASLLIRSMTRGTQAQLEKLAHSRHYGEIRDSVSVCWTTIGIVKKLSWEIIPACPKNMNTDGATDESISS